MKVIGRLTLNRKKDESIQSTLTSLEIESSIYEDLEFIELPIDDPRYISLKQEMTKKGVSIAETKRMEFDSEEIETAEYLRMAPKAQWGFPQPEDDFDYLNESYDLSSGCLKCRQGRRQNRPFLLKGMPKFGRNDIIALFWVYEFIITEKLRNLIEKENLTGADFYPVRRYRKSAPRIPLPGIYQLHVANDLPPMSPKTKFEFVTDLPKNIESCGCNIAGKNLPAAQMVYDRISLKNAKDFNRTSEFIGGGAYPTQKIIITNMVFQLFKKNKIRGVDFIPVLIED
jgi:hypothetical protein